MSDHYESIARRLDDAARHRIPCALVGAELGQDLGAAYAVQSAGIHLHLAGGRRIAGVKAALTAPALQHLLGADEPAWGTLFADQILADGEPIPATRVMAPRVEGEVAFILERDLDRIDLSVLDLIRAIACVAPAIEIPCRRYAETPGLADMIADNASAGLVVLGGPLRRMEGLDLAQIRHRMTRNGVVIAEGVGRDCLGHPLNAATWVARRAAAAGRPLRAGQIIMSGSLGQPQPAQAGDHIVSQIEGLGEVHARFTAAA